MQTIHVAVTGVGNPLGQNIYKALAMSSLPLKIYLLDAYPFSAGLLWKGQPVVCPFVKEDNYIEELAVFLRRERIQIIFFGTEAEPRAITPHLDQLRRETPTNFVLNDDRCLRIAGDKLLTARHLQDAGLDAPASADATDASAVESLMDQVGFPLVVKPRKGSAARGVIQVHDRKDLQSYLQPGYVVQECLLPSDQEYTVGVYRCRNGHIAGVTTIWRELNFGLTYKAIVLPHKKVESYAIRVIEAVGAIASCNVQLRLTRRGPVAFEVNPRFSSTTPVRAHFGVNEPEMAIREYVLGEDLDQVEARSGGMLRCWTELYLEEDELDAVRARDRSFWKEGR